MPVRKGEMSGRCSVCTHAQRYRIELALVGGASRESVAKRFQVSSDAAGRHLRNHVSPERRAQLLAGPLKLADLAEKAAEEGLALIDYLALVRSTLVAQFLTASETGDRNGTALIAGRLLRCLELTAQLTGELSRTGATITNNLAIVNSPYVADLQSMLIRTLQPYPEARQAVLIGLEELSRRSAEGRTSLPALEGSNAA
jgi:hypothetical protein